MDPVLCDRCGHQLSVGEYPFCGGDSAKHVLSRTSVIGDDIPGGEIVHHIFPEPRKFYSKTEIKKACNEGGWTRSGDSPKPYKVPWAGKSDVPKSAKP